MILLQLLRNQLYLNILFLSAADADISNGGDLLKLRNDLVVYIVVKVGLCLVIDRLLPLRYPPPQRTHKLLHGQ